MSLTCNGSAVKSFTYNGSKVNKIIYNGATIFTSSERGTIYATDSSYSDVVALKKYGRARLILYDGAYRAHVIYNYDTKHDAYDQNAIFTDHNAGWSGMYIGSNRKDYHDQSGSSQVWLYWTPDKLYAGGNSPEFPEATNWEIWVPGHSQALNRNNYWDDATLYPSYGYQFRLIAWGGKARLEYLTSDNPF